MIEVTDLNVHYGDLQVLWDVSLEVTESDSIVTIIGPNGSGKTTLLKTLSGILDPSSGTVNMFGKQVSAISPSDIVRNGFVHVPEERNLFPDLSVYENLWMGAYTRRENIEERIEEMVEMFPVLDERREQDAGTLSGGEQQMLAIARGMMADPKVLALDEPSGALAPQLAERVFEKVESISEDITVILVEQHVDQALELADRAYLLENGKIELEGEGAALRDSDHIRERYLSG